ncbi:MAG: beta-ketoacyl-[acyl-carrier-protein] synthase II [Dehalococcoidia bacterium]|nr:beta-ketoacyl-[acyl-carrier-protein] synthase II [Dehalococcoidia bacterium]MDH4299079.1 beta-ketoacyl-[acyl-carrier-protein] synthase II [Dehalococcoidia bacterium]
MNTTGAPENSMNSPSAINIPKVVVTGIGTINPLGLSVKEYWEGLAAGRSAIGPITHFDASKFRVKVDAEVRGFDATKYMDLKVVDRTSRTIQFAIAAAKEAVQSAGLDMAGENPERVGVIISTMTEQGYVIRGWELYLKVGPRRADPLFITKSTASAASMQVGMMLGAKGPNSSVNSLCASGADAIGTATNFIRLGYADVMIAGGSDASLEPVGMAGIDQLGALTHEPDPSKACRPFDLNRNGFVYAEGAGLLVLESYEHAKRRGAPILAEVAGAGWSFDAHDATAPAPEAEAYAMRTALQNAGLKIEDVDYINAHGTSTKLNDACETKAIKMMFGAHAYEIPISSTKSMIGHGITAAGAVETVAAILVLNKGIIHPTINYETPDPDCDLDYVPNVARPAQVNVCLKNSFGLGGENCCLVLRRVS